MQDITKLERILKRHGQSVTATRRKVFAALHDQEPLTMRELVERCQSVDRASVYRTVALFERLGVVQRLQSGWKYKLELSDTFHNHHHHATCWRCGHVTPLPEDSRLEAYLRQLAATHCFLLQTHQIELGGLCEDCQALVTTSQ